MIYVHIPFCARRCLYCDFFSVGGKLADWDAYISALLNEAEHKTGIQKLSSVTQIPTIYIGGGTPSLIPPKQFAKLSSGVLKLVADPIEFTLEVNPDDVTEDKAETWHNSGVTRISMGVQSFVDSELKAIGRRHDAATVVRAYNILRRYFNNISLDVMFGLPLQTLESFAYSLDKTLSLNPDHISAYSLMYEEKSALTSMLHRGLIRDIPEEETASMFEHLSSRLIKSGYEHYEISNFAKIAEDFSYRSVHNANYWTGSPYIGLGPGAHEYDGFRTRSYNLPDIDSYIRFWNNNGLQHISNNKDMPNSICEKEFLTDEELREEYIMTRLRTCEGINLDDFEVKFGKTFLACLLNDSRKYLNSGLIEIRNDRLKLTKKGLFISDDIISGLF